MTAVTFQLLSPVDDADRWDELVARLPPELQDAHFRRDYASAHAHVGMNASLAAYVWGEYVALQTIVIRGIDGSDLVDACSPPGYGGPATNHGPILYAWMRLELGKVLAQRAAVCEFCLFNPMLASHQRELVKGCWIEGKPAVVMDLSDIGRGYHRRRSVGIDTARKFGVVVTIEEDSREFLRLYRQAMDRKRVGGRWNLPYEYLEALCCVGTVFAARVDGVVESMAIVLGRKDDRSFYYYLAANAGLHPRAGANDLLVHEIARWARYSGATRLHLGGGVTSAADDSVLFFKAGFSDVRVPTTYSFRVFDKPAYERLCADKRDLEREQTGEHFRSEFLPLYRREE